MDPVLRRSGRPLTVLIVEDQVLVAMDHARMVREARGNVVGIVKSGEEAVEATQRLRPDVVLLDIRLAGRIDGIEAAEAITAVPGVALIIITASDDAATRKCASRLGALVLDKPVLPSTLRRAIADACALDSGTIGGAGQV